MCLSKAGAATGKGPLTAMLMDWSLAPTASCPTMASPVIQASV